MKKATTYIFCNKYHPRKNGNCSISICITFNRKKKYYDTGYEMPALEFDLLFAPKIKPDQKKILMALNAEELRAKDCIDQIKTSFTFERFERLYISNIAITDSLRSNFDGYIARMDPEERYSTITSYQSVRNSLEKFKSGALVGDVTVAFLKEYEAWILKNGGSVTTVGFYCRSLRSVLNWVIKSGRLSKELYPFGMARDDKYEIPIGRNPKKALQAKDLYKIFNYACEPGSTTEMCRDYWLFMYLSNGMNMKDMLLLKWENIIPSGLRFIREKTKRTKKERGYIQVVMQAQMADIIARWGNLDKSPEQYIFPHLELGMNAEQIRKKVQLVTSVVNDHMQKVVAGTEIERKVRTNDARHSYATIMKNSGAPLALISEALGHGSFKTTQNYLDSFETDQLKKATTALTSFLK